MGLGSRFLDFWLLISDWFVVSWFLSAGILCFWGWVSGLPARALRGSRGWGSCTVMESTCFPLCVAADVFDAPACAAGACGVSPRGAVGAVRRLDWGSRWIDPFTLPAPRASPAPTIPSVVLRAEEAVRAKEADRGRSSASCSPLPLPLPPGLDG